MSHTTTITGLKITDMRALALAVQRIEGARLETYTAPQEKRLFDGKSLPNITASVRLPGWQYPVHLDSTGNAHYDNYNGRWGENSTLDKLKQGYAPAKAASLARSNGYMVSERAKADGSITLTLTR
jgi:hypothetical protein